MPHFWTWPNITGLVISIPSQPHTISPSTQPCRCVQPAWMGWPLQIGSHPLNVGSAYVWIYIICTHTCTYVCICIWILMYLYMYLYMIYVCIYEYSILESNIQYMIDLIDFVYLKSYIYICYCMYINRLLQHQPINPIQSGVRRSQPWNRIYQLRWKYLTTFQGCKASGHWASPGILEVPISLRLVPCQHIADGGQSRSILTGQNLIENLIFHMTFTSKIVVSLSPFQANYAGKPRIYLYRSHPKDW